MTDNEIVVRYCERCYRVVQEHNWIVKHRLSKNLTYYLCYRCYQRAIKKTLKVRVLTKFWEWYLPKSRKLKAWYNKQKSLQHWYEVISNVKQQLQRKVKRVRLVLRVRWFKFKYGWKHEGKRGKYYLKKSRFLIPGYYILHLVWCEIKKQQIRAELMNTLSISARRELSEHYYKIFPEIFERYMESEQEIEEMEKCLV